MLDRSIRAEVAPAFLFLMAALVASNLSLASPAAAQHAEIVGESGGRYFDFNCGPGKVLVGLRGSAGVIIDNLRAICGRVNQGGGFTDAAPMGPVIGHARPEDRHVECPAGYGVAQARVGRSNDHPYLVAIDLICIELGNRADGGQTHVEFRGSGNLYGYSGGIGVNESAGGYTGISSCEGQYAIGIRGRAEQYISAFGLMCGSPVSIDGRTLGKRKKPTVELDRRRDTSATTSIPETQRTLGKRKRPAPAGGEPTGGAASEAAPQSSDPYTKGGPSIFTDSTPTPPAEGGFSINSDSQLPPPSAEAPPPPSPAPEISPLIAGDYSTRVVIRESRCIVPVNGNWQSMIGLEGGSVLVIPIQQYNNLFAGPLVLHVNGTSLTQTASVSLATPGGRANYPAQVTGGFDPDFQRFEVRFEVDAPLCSFDGVITGAKP